MNISWGRLPSILRNRPFDIFIALMMFLAGVYQLADPAFPESQQDFLSSLVLITLSIYLMVSSVIILVFLFHKCANPFFKMYGEMYGWMFLNAAILAITILDIYTGIVYEVSNTPLFISFTTFWILLSLATFIKWFDIYYVIRKVVK